MAKKPKEEDYMESMKMRAGKVAGETAAGALVGAGTGAGVGAALSGGIASPGLAIAGGIVGGSIGMTKAIIGNQAQKKADQTAFQAAMGSYKGGLKTEKLAVAARKEQLKATKAAQGEEQRQEILGGQPSYAVAYDRDLAASMDPALAGSTYDDYMSRFG
mgnify:CR=1 FL=1